MLAGLPKAPNYYSPINNPERALRRRNLVINNMLEDGKITAAEALRAKDAPLQLKLQAEPNDIAPYFVEEIRQYLEKKYGAEEVHEGGLRVYTSLNLEMQHAAQQAVRDGLAAYERRHGWKGNLLNVVANGDTLATYHHVDWDGAIVPGSYVHALVTEVDPLVATIKFGNYEARLGPEEIKWTRHTSPQEFLTVGDIVYVKVEELNGNSSRVSLEQESGVQGALMALDNSTGDVKAMVGGRDFEQSKFNRATQALRQVGSSFKPYIYTAAIDQGLTPDDTVLDAPITFNTPSGPYTPHNYDGKFEGVITFRHALAESRNIPALKVTERVGGIKTVIEYARKFGITSPLLPYLPVALGAADITLAEQTAAFTTFPNDGVRVVPRYIRKVTDYDGRVLEEDYPEVKDVVSARTARIMVSMLREVVLHGTGYAASKLNHPLGGKTGTTNDFTDAWFVGFSPSMTCGVWVGFDEKKTLGNKETGASAALPIWMDFMRVALQGRESEDFAAPPPMTPSAVAQKVETPDGCVRRQRGALMRRFFRYLVRVLVLVVVFMASVLTAMRFAIHGRQTTIPKIVGLTSSQAERAAGRSWSGAGRGRPLLQLRCAAGPGDVAGSGARDAGAARLACARGRKHGSAAGRYSRSYRRTASGPRRSISAAADSSWEALRPPRFPALPAIRSWRRVRRPTR